ncbi:MAG: hypothetical protein KY459_16530 [Acidobacteria bacterium]|nr:hypothetical protein [Acidobacteriota bacterium]
MRSGLITIIFLSVSIFSAVPALSQGFDEEESEVYLLPVVAKELPGAHGSIWQSELVVANNASHTIFVDTLEICFTLCTPKEFPAGSIRLIPTMPQPGGLPGLLLYTTHGADAPTFNLRMQDLSRQAQTWGTQIPVVARSEMSSAPIFLLNVPLTSGFRQTLRVYMPSTNEGMNVVVSVLHPQNETVVLGQAVLSVDGGSHPYKPAYAQLDGVQSIISSSEIPSTVNIKIVPERDLPFWAFISVTNNETQHVTTIVP